MHSLKNILKRIPGIRVAARAFRGVTRFTKRSLTGPSQAEQYDIETLEVMRRVLAPDASAIDIGANNGEILAQIVRLAPLRQHWAFEPIPRLAEALQSSFPNVSILPFALADISDRTVFHVAKHNMAYSSLEDRDPALLDRIGLHDSSMEVIVVDVRRLDDIIPESAQIALIKIDVEGSEARTIAGALRTINRCKPIVVFEAGFYGEAQARNIFDMFQSCTMHVSLMSRWLKNEPPPNSFE